MSEKQMYDAFSKHYDHFVNWEERLSVELPFLISELNDVHTSTIGKFHVLDAACGTGQHAIALAKEGFKCMGADISEDMVNTASQSALKEGLDMDFQEAGFGKYRQTFGENCFDGLLCLGNSLPHLLDEVSLADAMADFASVLKTGGKLILQNRNFEPVLAKRERWMPPQTFQDDENTWIFGRFYDFDPDGLLTFNIQILHSENEKPFNQQVISTRLWPINKPVLEKFIKRAGFHRLKFYGNLEGDAFDASNSGNLVITARAR